MPGCLMSASVPARRPALGAVRRLGVCFFAWLLAVLVFAAPAAAQQQAIPALQQRVTDTTGTLDAATQQRLTQSLAGLEQRKGAQSPS